MLVLLPSKLKTAELRERRDQAAAEVDALRDQTEALVRETQALEDDPWSIERALRGRLGYLRTGERVYRAGG